MRQRRKPLRGIEGLSPRQSEAPAARHFSRFACQCLGGQRNNRQPAGAGLRPDHLRRPIAIHFGPYDVRPHDRDIGRGLVLAGFDS